MNVRDTDTQARLAKKKKRGGEIKPFKRLYLPNEVQIFNIFY